LSAERENYQFTRGKFLPLCHDFSILFADFAPLFLCRFALIRLAYAAEEKASKASFQGSFTPLTPLAIGLTFKRMTTMTMMEMGEISGFSTLGFSVQRNTTVNSKNKSFPSHSFQQLKRGKRMQSFGELALVWISSHVRSPLALPCLGAEKFLTLPTSPGGFSLGAQGQTSRVTQGAGRREGV